MVYYFSFEKMLPKMLKHDNVGKKIRFFLGKKEEITKSYLIEKFKRLKIEKLCLGERSSDKQ